MIKDIDLEPHPVSGELELEDPRPAKYRRLDEETLHCRIEVEQFGLLPVYVWCEKDEHGGTEPGWKLADLRTLDDSGDADQWFDTPSQANDAAVSQPEQTLQPQPNNHAAPPAQEVEEDDTNDDYWAQYDQTPSRTPAPKRSPAPVPSSTLQMGSVNRPRSRSEMEYFSRYGSEVQPALDSHDPDEDHGEFGESTLNGDSLVRGGQENSSNDISQQADYLSSLQPHTGWSQTADPTAPAPQLENDISMPRAISPTASNGSIDKLEEQAAAMSSPQEDRALVAIKQHISTDIKSLFRLAKNSGMDRKEFERVVRTELDVLGFMEDGE